MPASESTSPQRDQTGEEAPPPRPVRPLRRRLALLVIVAGIAGLVVWWSRSRPTEVEVVYDFGRQASRVRRVALVFERSGKERQPVEVTFPDGKGAPRRYRHELKLDPGKYTIRARIHLGPRGDRSAEVRKLTRRVEIESGTKQRITLRFGP